MVPKTEDWNLPKQGKEGILIWNVMWASAKMQQSLIGWRAHIDHYNLTLIFLMKILPMSNQENDQYNPKDHKREWRDKRNIGPFKDNKWGFLEEVSLEPDIMKWKLSPLNKKWKHQQVLIPRSVKSKKSLLIGSGECLHPNTCLDQILVLPLTRCLSFLHNSNYYCSVYSSIKQV